MALYIRKLAIGFYFCNTLTTHQVTARLRDIIKLNEQSEGEELISGRIVREAEGGAGLCQGRGKACVKRNRGENRRDFRSQVLVCY